MSNDICITGNLTAAPVLRFTQNGRAVFNARIADTPRRKNPDSGEWEDAGPTLYVNIALWGQEAEALAEIIGEQERGRLTAWGTLGLEQYTTHDGQERETLAVKAQAVKYHPPRDGGQQQASNRPASSQRRPAPPANPFSGSRAATQDPFAGAGSASAFPEQPPF